MIDLPHVSFLTKKYLKNQNKFLFGKDLEFLLFSFELYLLKVVLLFSYIELLLIKNLCEFVFFELNLSFYLLNHLGLDVSPFLLMDI